jgi:PhnB protein
MATLNPYLIFAGKAEDAFNMYKTVFGGEFAATMRFKDVPGENKPSANWENKLVHVALPVGDTILMGGDCPEDWAGNYVPGSAVHISYTAKSEADVDEKFKALSEGGEVHMPVAKTFWGDYFGMVQDKFGIQWMLSYNYK